MTEKEKQENSGDDRLFWLWVGMLLPPTAWAAQLQTLYLTSEYGCANLDLTWNHIVSLVALVLSLFGGLTAWTQWRTAGSSTDVEAGRPISRRRFMAMLGILTGALFSTIIVAQWLPTALEVPCGK